jgi:hypothetical protein
MSSCSVSMRWKMYFSCYTHRLNNSMIYLHSMYLLLLKLKPNISHWGRNLGSVAVKLTILSLYVTGKIHKVTWSAKMSWLFPEYLCIPMPTFSSPLDVVFKCLGRRDLHIVNLGQHYIFLRIYISVVHKFFLPLNFPSHELGIIYIFMHITAIRILTEKHSGRVFVLSVFFAIVDTTKLLKFSLIYAI